VTRRLPIAAIVAWAQAAAACAVACAMLAACAVPPAVEALDAAPQIWDVRAGRFVTESALVADLVRARYRLLGEVHDNPAHHAIRARLIAKIAGNGVRPAVVFEQFDLEHDKALRAAQAAGADAERLADAGDLDRKGWRWPLHKPIVEAALALHLPVRAGNLPRSGLGVDGPAAAATNASWHARLVAAPWTDANARALSAEIVESHCGMLPARVVPRLVVAQRERDAAMAEALVEDATDDGAILIAGNGHVRADRGVPVYLHARGLPDAGTRSVSVGLVEVDPGDAGDPDFPRQIVADHPGFDYLWLTRSVARDDPCAEFTGRKATPGS
jgi:uncharacterized iron-regulated protein